MRMVKFLSVVAAAVLTTVLLSVAAPVAVIQGHGSLAAGERRFAGSLARHVVRWYQEAGVEAVLSDDMNLNRTLSGKKVAVLVYTAQPDAGQLAVLRGFLSRGGKLIVCYSSSAELAAMMGMRGVGYVKGSTDGRWSQMRFDSDLAPRGSPGSILQTSGNLFVVAPVEGRSQVLAWWHNRKGERSSEPAWLVSGSGYWMTHILTADGEADAKGRLLLAMAAAHDPSIWQPAANRVLQQARAAGLNGGQLAARVAREPNAQRKRRAQNALQAADKCDARAVALIKAGRGYDAWQAANELRSRRYEVYGMLQSARKGEIRAVWDHSGMGLYPGEWHRTCKLLRDAGISDIYVNVAGAGFAHYASSVLPRSRVFQEQGDQLKACVAAARPLGLRVHAWLLCFSTEGATRERVESFRKRGWMLDAGAGRWLDPAVPEVRSYLISAVQEMATRYGVDGVHLDFVRYPDFNSSLGSVTRQRFERGSGQRVANWPDDVKSGAMRQSFKGWRVNQITEFVEGSRRVMRRHAAGKVLTTAVYGKYPSCVDAVGQDWESWINLGLVDYVVPMNYSEDMGRFNEWLSQQTRTRAQALKIVAGIGVSAAESRLDSTQVIDQVQAARRAGCAGFALFNLDTTMHQEILPVMRLGLIEP